MTPEEKQREERQLLRLFAFVYGPIALLVIGIFFFVLYEQGRIERSTTVDSSPVEQGQ